MPADAAAITIPAASLAIGDLTSVSIGVIAGHRQDLRPPPHRQSRPSDNSDSCLISTDGQQRATGMVKIGAI